MSSETSAQWPVVAPGFMYIVKMGDYTHILQPADQKSSEHLNLAQVALRDINVARRLLEERGPFLLLDKQEKMNEMITDTESAINRVIGILKPARVEHISEQSIRFNTRSPWALQDDPKSAATFGRLQLTHNALKTVVHDLSNIESTVQLDKCSDRAEAAAAIPNGQPPILGTVQTSASKGANDLLTWKRSRRVNRQGQPNGIYSGDGSTNSERNGNDVFSPVSPDESRTTMSVLSGRLHRDSISEDSNLQLDSAIDHASDASEDRLPVIHELEGGSSIVQLGPVRPPDAESDDMKYSTPKGKSKAFDDVKAEGDLATASNQADLVARISHRRRPSSPPALRVTPPTLKHNNRVKRETWGELRQRSETEKQPLESLPSNIVQPAPQSMGEKSSNNYHHLANNIVQRPERFHSLKAKLRLEPANGDVGSLSNGTVNGPPAHIQNESSMSRPPAPVFEESDTVSSQLNNEPMRNARKFVGENESSIKSATYPPVKTQLLPPAEFGLLMSTTSGLSSHVLSPSRAQLSPLEQTESPNVPESDETPLSPHERVHQIFQIDPELTRLPSLLKAARSRRQVELAFVSKQDSDNANELHIPNTVLSAPIKEPPDRSLTAPPMSHVSVQEPRNLSHGIPSREDLTHLRSMSDTAVPQVSTARGPIPPRKPLPYQSSPLPSREPSPHVVSRIATPVPEHAQSELVQPPANIPQSTKTTSGPPSPIQSDHPRNLIPQIPRAPSTQNLAVQIPSSTSQASSRKSSISAEGAMNKDQTLLVQPQKTNGLAMNPPEIPDRQTSAYQAQKLAEIKQGKQVAQDSAQTPDYRSPAWQHSRQFFNPAHNVPLEQAPVLSMAAPSRFRDQDQTKAGMMYAARSRTVPEPGRPSQDEPDQGEQPRRASEQAIPASIAPPLPPSPPLLQKTEPQPQVEPQQPQLVPPEQEESQALITEAPPRPSPSPKPSEYTKSSFLQHQAAKLHARQQLNPVPVLPPAPAMGFQQVRPPLPGQAVPLRLILPPRVLPAAPNAPPARPSKPSKQTVPKTAHREVTTAQSTEYPPAKDQQHPKQRLFRPSMDKRLTPPKEVSRENSRAPSMDGVTQQSQQPPQQQTQPQVQPQIQPISQQQLQQPQLQIQPQPVPQPEQQPQQEPHHHPPPPHSNGPTPHPTHDCTCDDDNTNNNPVSSPPAASKSTSSESLEDLIKMNNKLARDVPLAQNVPRILAPMRNEDHLAKASPAVTVASTQSAPAPAAAGRQSKKKSWLAHQAGKIAGKNGS